MRPFENEEADHILCYLERFEKVANSRDRCSRCFLEGIKDQNSRLEQVNVGQILRMVTVRVNFQGETCYHGS